ncbi:MAG: hypothetical protein C0446_13225 [Chitinophaga sp.]|nr:hypothetical protein [Chitinophaga sp.]
MKIICSIVVSVLLSNIIIAQSATDVNIHDTRAANLPPLSFSTYPGNAGMSMRTRFDFKDRNTIGAPGSGYYSTLMTIPQWGDNSGGKMHQLSFNDGGIFYRQGVPSATSWENWQKLLIENEFGNVGVGTQTPNSKFSLANSIDYGVHGPNATSLEARNLNNNGTGGYIQISGYTGNTIASYQFGGISGGKSTNIGDGNYGGYLSFWTTSSGNNIEWNSAFHERLRITNNGNVGIGTISPTERLSVNGNIRAKKLIVSQQNWSDYVFYKNYKLRPLNELEKFIQKYQHLPDVPSTKEVQSKGINVGETQALLLKKIEELTLYVIELKKENLTQQQEINDLKKKNSINK